MKVKLKVSQRAVVEVEGDKQTDIFQALSSMQEVFSESHCGCCGQDTIKFVARQNKDDDWFYEMKCYGDRCYATLAFGSRKKPAGQLYPKRKWDQLSLGEKERRKSQEDKCSNGYLPDRGWWKWTPPKTSE